MESEVEDIHAVERAQSACDPSSPYTTAFVSKMVAVPKSVLPDTDGENGDRFLGFGRVFSGCLKPYTRVHVLNALYDPSQPNSETRQVRSIGRKRPSANSPYFGEQFFRK